MNHYLVIAQISCLSSIKAQWLREDITYHTCYEQDQELIDAVADFQRQINTNPVAVSDRLWVKKHLEPEEEKLRFSK